MRPKQETLKPYGRAIVIGGGLAGFASARVLADYFREVTILERDPLPGNFEFRKGQPQGKHSHVLLKAGADTLAEMFPNIWEEMHKQGTTKTENGLDWVWFHHGVWKYRADLGMTVYAQSRPFLEWHVHRRLAAYQNVSILDGCAFERFLHDDLAGRVTGVIVTRGKKDEIITGDLVVDASGRGTRTPMQLQNLGYGRPIEEEVHIDMCYASCIVRPPKDYKPDWKALIVYGSAPNDKRIGYISPVEGKDWIVTLAGYHGDHPPKDYEGFLNFSRSLTRPDHYEAISRAHQLTPIARHKLPSDIRRHYQKMRSFPEGLVVLGDATVSFNPIFGQGMTTALLAAKTLGQCIVQNKDKSLRGLSKKFQKRICRFIDIAWLLATTEDMRYPETRASRKPFGLAFLNWYKGQLLQLSSVDRDIARRFLLVMHFQRGLAAILNPLVILKALIWPLRRARYLKNLIRPAHPEPIADRRERNSEAESDSHSSAA